MQVRGVRRWVQHFRPAERAALHSGGPAAAGPSGAVGIWGARRPLVGIRQAMRGLDRSTGGHMAYGYQEDFRKIKSEGRLSEDRLMSWRAAGARLDRSEPPILSCARAYYLGPALFDHAGPTWRLVNENSSRRLRLVFWRRLLRPCCCRWRRKPKESKSPAGERARKCTRHSEFPKSAMNGKPRFGGKGFSRVDLHGAALLLHNAHVPSVQRAASSIDASSGSDMDACPPPLVWLRAHRSFFFDWEPV